MKIPKPESEKLLRKLSEKKEDINTQIHIMNIVYWFFHHGNEKRKSC